MRPAKCENCGRTEFYPSYQCTYCGKFHFTYDDNWISVEDGLPENSGHYLVFAHWVDFYSGDILNGCLTRVFYNGEFIN